MALYISQMIPIVNEGISNHWNEIQNGTVECNMEWIVNVRSNS